MYALAVSSSVDYIAALPLPSNASRRAGILTQGQAIKDLIREPGIRLNSVFYPLGTRELLVQFETALCSGIRDTLFHDEVMKLKAERQLGQTDTEVLLLMNRCLTCAVSSIASSLFGAMSRTLLDGDAFEVAHAMFSVTGKIFLGPSPKQIPISLFISPGGVLTIEGIARYNAVHFPPLHEATAALDNEEEVENHHKEHIQSGPEVWAMLETVVIENLFFDTAEAMCRAKELQNHLPDPKNGGEEGAFSVNSFPEYRNVRHLTIKPF